MSEQSENIYINLVKNPKWDGVESNQPIYVGPPNVEAQQKGKNWTIGAKINGVWYNQAAFDDVAEDGTPTGGINVVLTPQDNSGSAGSSGGSKQQSFAQRKPYAKPAAYGNNRPSRY